MTDTTPTESEETVTIKLTGPAWPREDDGIWPVQGSEVEAVWRGEVSCWVFTYGGTEFFGGPVGSPYAVVVAAGVTE